MTTKEIEMTEQRPPKGTSARADYVRLLMEATQLAYRMAKHLNNDSLPEVINWGHVGEMAETVKGLHAVADRMFAEGEYAPEAK